MKREFLLVGLTGGIGTGKSAVSRMFRDLGCLIIDADILAREVVEPGEPAYGKIVAEFGRQILDDEGQIDRKKLGALVFGDEAKRKRLEGFTHPEIRQRQARIVAELITEGFDGIVIFDAALLVETGGAANMDRLVVVYADEATQLKRLMLRDDISEAEARTKIESQMSLAEKVKQAHYVVDNSGTREETERRVREVHLALLADLKARQASPP
ncbi:MAG: dephospho-CoA kinase [Candidatus Rokubacteria bacterium]|nr:dephospho-CoA kinase [Candidatus Rokubacteria bacterium]